MPKDPTQSVSIEFSTSCVERFERLRTGQASAGAHCGDIGTAHCGDAGTGAHCGDIGTGAHCGDIGTGAHCGD